MGKWGMFPNPLLLIPRSISCLTIPPNPLLLECIIFGVVGRSGKMGSMSGVTGNGKGLCIWCIIVGAIAVGVSGFKSRPTWLCKMGSKGLAKGGMEGIFSWGLPKESVLLISFSRLAKECSMGSVYVVVVVVAGMGEMCGGGVSFFGGETGGIVTDLNVWGGIVGAAG